MFAWKTISQTRLPGGNRCAGMRCPVLLACICMLVQSQHRPAVSCQCPQGRWDWAMLPSGPDLVDVIMVLLVMVACSPSTGSAANIAGSPVAWLSGAPCRCSIAVAQGSAARGFRAPPCSICLQTCLPAPNCSVLLLQEENVRLFPEEGGTFLLHELGLPGLQDVQQARKQYKVTLQSCCAGCLRVTSQTFLGGQALSITLGSSPNSCPACHT